MHDFYFFFRKEDQFEGKRKGKSLIGFPDNYVLLDLETTGLDSYHDEIIEVAALKVKNNKTVDTFQSLIKPSREIDEFIMNLTGITNEMLKDAPPPKEVLKRFKDFVGDIVVMGYSVNFDISFLYHKCEDYFRNDFVDVLRLARFLLPDIGERSLKNVANYFKLKPEGLHRALRDCEITKLCYERIRDIMIETYETPELFVKNRVNRSYPRKTPVLRAKDITTDKTEFNEDDPFFEQHCVVTGKLEKMTRAEVMQIIADRGGVNEDSVNKRTNILIIGSFDYTPTIKGGKSSKQKSAERLILKGSDIKIISERVFYEMIGLE